MIEIMRCNDMVALSFAEALLRDAGIDPVLLDGHTSVLEGSISAIQRRLMVPDDDEAQARRILTDARLPFVRAARAG